MIKLIYGTLDDFLIEYPGMDEILKLAIGNKDNILVKNIINFYLAWQTFNTKYSISEENWLEMDKNNG